MVRPARHTMVAVRGTIALVIGIVVAIALTAPLGVAAGLLSGWATAAVTAAGWALVVVWPMDAAATRAHATAEDPGRQASRFIAIIGSVASIAAVVVVLTQHTTAKGGEAFVLAGIALASVVASWLLIQTVYTLRIADEYYTEPVGGISFNQSDEPTYTDFAYIALGVGLTYQVADTNIASNSIRRVIIAQSLLGYLFGAVILGTVINLLAGL